MAVSAQISEQGFSAYGRASSIGTPLGDLLLAEAIQPGAEPSYSLCKLIYTYHPIGAKSVDKPLKMAMSQDREFTIKHGLAHRVIDQFKEHWESLVGRDVGADDVILQAARVSRIYGTSTLTIIVEDDDPTKPLDFSKLAGKNIAFNIWDPLNTSGSIVLSQNPNAADFMKKLNDVSVQGQKYHPSRTVIKHNGDPIYLSYVPSAFGFVGRSVYQAALYPLKTFIQTMITDDMMSRKAGVMVAKIHQPGSISDRIMDWMNKFKRNLVRQAQTDNVIAISSNNNEEIESLDLHNLEAPAALSRKHCLQNIALGMDMPAVILNDESYSSGLNDGTEDANDVSVFVDEMRKWLHPYYTYFDRIVMHRAWTPEFFNSLKNEFPKEFQGITYEMAFSEWQRSFKFEWPCYLREPESEKAKLEKVREDGLCQAAEVMLPMSDPVNKTAIVQWVVDNLNEYKRLFPVPLAINNGLMEKFLKEEADRAAKLFEQVEDKGAKEKVEAQLAIANPKQRGLPKPKAQRDSQYELPFYQEAAE